MAGKYHNWGRLGCFYVLLTRSETTYIHACNVRAIKFAILLPIDHMVQGNELMYKFNVHAKDGIRHDIASIDL